MSRVERVDVVVVGAGLAGLAAALTAARNGAVACVLEAAVEPGGLTRSVRTPEGYVFDYSGHLLHLAKPVARALVESVTDPNGWALVERRSAVVLRDRIIPYPFQLHLAYAPDDVRDECLAGLPQEAPGEEATMGSLGEWIHASLGPGIARHFMVPYNEKLATVPPSELTCDALGRFVPRPSLGEIREGASSARVLQTGYNARFLYPRSGGIDLLWRSLAQKVDRLVTDARVAVIDTSSREVVLQSGARVAYREGVLSSAPLPETCGLVRPQSATLRLAALLRSTEVTCVNVGLRRLAPRFEGLQWLYLPDPRFTAHRVGFYNGFTSAMAPPGRFGVYVEITHRGERSERELCDRAVDDLLELGAIRSREEIELVLPLRIPRAYVIHDENCAFARARLLQELELVGVHMVGRYGRWEYASMEDALVQGIDAAERIVGAEALLEAGL